MAAEPSPRTPVRPTGKVLAVAAAAVTEAVAEPALVEEAPHPAPAHPGSRSGSSPPAPWVLRWRQRGRQCWRHRDSRRAAPQPRFAWPRSLDWRSRPAPSRGAVCRSSSSRRGPARVADCGPRCAHPPRRSRPAPKQPDQPDRPCWARRSGRRPVSPGRALGCGHVGCGAWDLSRFCSSYRRRTPPSCHISRTSHRPYRTSSSTFPPSWRVPTSRS